MGSASSRMSASPALVHPGRASDTSTVSTSTSTVTTSASTVQQSSPSPIDTISQPKRVSTPPTTPPLVSMKLDKGKGKEVVEDREEGEISDDESLPIHIAPPTVSSTKKSSGDRPGYESYRPTPRPRGSSQPQYPPQYPRPYQSFHPNQRMHQSQSPQEMYFPQQIQSSQFPQYGHNVQHHQQQKSRLSNGSSHKPPISPKTIEAIPFQHTLMPDKPVSISAIVPQPTTPAMTQSPPEDSLALPSSLTAEEAEQYMDIIRNLMLEGVRPDILIKRGATPKYVSMVCREIVAGSRKKKDGPPGTEADTVLTPELETSTLPTGPPSPSLDSVPLARDRSASSISSVETMVKVERIISPEQPTRLIPTSSWAPSQKLPKSPIHVESYRPGRPIASSSGPNPRLAQPVGPSNPPAGPSTPPGPLFGPGGVQRPAVPKNSLRARTSELSPVVKRPEFIANGGQADVTVSAIAPVNGVAAESPGPQPHIAPTPVAHGAHSVLASLINGPVTLAAPLPRPISAPSTVTALPISNSPASSASRASTMNALLESKRRAMESMKRARKASENVPAVQPRPPTPPLGIRDSPLPSRLSSVPPVLPLTQENLEDQVAALEQEVLGLREDAPIIVDDEEEGEIPDEVVPPPQPRMAPIIPATTPIRLNKSTKRPNAEDMMDSTRSQSVSSRSIHPAKRRQFGTALRMKRLIISLDESDDEDNEDQAPTPTAADLEADRQRLLKEKEDDMMKLREKILRLQAKAEKEKKAKAKDLALQAASEVADEVTPAVIVAAEDVVMAESADVDHPETPALATMPLVNDPSDGQVPPGVAEEGDDNSMAIDQDEEEAAKMRTPELSSSSAINGDTPTSTLLFEAYRPILDRYPQLAYSTVKTLLPRFNWPRPDEPKFDTARISSIILTRRMQFDPNAVICGAEAAGGSCADPTCSDLHLSRDLDRPHDDDLLEYLYETLSATVDKATLGQILMKAKAALGISDIPSISGSKKKKKNTESRTTILRDDQAQSQSIGSASQVA